MAPVSIPIFLNKLIILAPTMISHMLSKPNLFASTATFFKKFNISFLLPSNFSDARRPSVTFLKFFFPKAVVISMVSWNGFT